ncbi:MAG TPA: SMC-Scp complex subunit ScpB [Myxococcota bacterium]|nr:SMC-Scp complex subunit ScpB [Myxococcota bacterium]
MAIRKTREELDTEMASSVPPAFEGGATEASITPVATAPRLKLAIESLLFASSDPLGLPGLLNLLSEFHPDLTSRTLRQAIENLKSDLREQGRGIRIAEVAGGFQMRTPSEAAPYIKKLVTRRPARLTQATLECLAIVAYRQPVTRGEVEDIRGVDSGAVLRNLLLKKLLKILGRKEEPGRPLLYGTSGEFLEFFSMKDLGSLPTLKDFAELSDEHRDSLGLQQPIDEKNADEIEPTLPASLTLEDPNAYAPPGEDEVVQELADALDELRRRDRRLKKEVFGAAKAVPDAQVAPEAQDAQAIPEADDTQEREGD